MSSAETTLQPADYLIATAHPMSLSVIVPNFNHAKLIPRALRAFLNQAPPAKEIVVIDDGSTDDSVKVIEEFARRYRSIRLIKHQTNQGIVAAVKSGLEVATGEYLLFGSSDDIVLPGLFARAQAALSQNPRAALFCSGVALVDDHNRVIGLRPVTQPCRRTAYLSPADVRRAIRTTDFWYLGTTTVYRRRLLAEIGYLSALGLDRRYFGRSAVGLPPWFLLRSRRSRRLQQGSDEFLRSKCAVSRE